MAGWIVTRASLFTFSLLETFDKGRHHCSTLNQTRRDDEAVVENKQLARLKPGAWNTP